MSSIRHWIAPDHTRIVIDLSGKPKFRYGRLSNPARIVIDLADTKFASSVRELQVSNGLVEKVRINPLPKRTAQIVVDLVKETEFSVFYLKKAAGRPHRIVVDVKNPVEVQVKTEAKETLGKLKEKTVRIVVIDPGHGGEDPGAVGPRGIKEKDVCLKIARDLKTNIDQMDGMKAFLTRTGDYFVPLRKRTQIAKGLGADVFISLHANASRSKRAYGTEVFFLSASGATDEAAREVAIRENEADLAGGIAPEAEDDIVSILTDLKQSNTLVRSSELAEKIMDSLGRHHKLVTRGVKQARFTVLKSADFPSVLAEIAFISNASEATLLKSDEFHDDVATLLAGALRDYCMVYASLGSPSGTVTE
ncbi:MAG: N-acetylmuramoyl-L-alanine amidase [Candidatus Eisenbacteria bacterium]|nr:N-acetylmuramoyl-L-alanine amidase [Candidatus Eisenbacteria bacterium]